MGSIRARLMLVVLSLTLGLATSAAAQPRSGPEYIPLATPCRVLDTRVTGTPLQANVPRTIQIGGVTTGGANCGVPTTAVGAELNFTITLAQGPGHMAAWPSGALPQTAAVNFQGEHGENVGNALDIGLGAGGTVIVQSTVATHLVVDVYGYFIDVEVLGSNTALGANAFASNTTGVSNTALGANALLSNTTGNSNTATGVAALTTNTTGNNNTATGFNALFSNTTGSGNTATGLAALSVNTTGNNNTAVGIQALTSNTTGGNNTATGAGALGNNTAGFANTAVGFQALVSNTTGVSNTALGAAALPSNTTANFNTAVGNRALFVNTTGAANTALGFAALLSNTGGEQNTAIGVNALASNTLGGDNTAIGNTALVNNSTGEDNTALGIGALVNNTTGDRNIAVGAGAGTNVTVGNDNIHIGNLGVITDTAFIRIGTQGTQTATFIAGISGQNVGELPVFVTTAGQLGSPLSTRRAKDEIRDMGDASQALLKVRPVTFRYTPEHDDGSRLLEYGLIAEEVAAIYPELVVLGKDGQPAGVRYHVLPAMLLNELQRQQRTVEAQASRLAEYDQRFRDQTRLIEELTARLSRLEATGAAAGRRGGFLPEPAAVPEALLR